MSARSAPLSLVLVLACGSASVSVPSHPHPELAPAEVVPSLPPPAQIEHVDIRPPVEGCLWADGRWEWNAQRWDWRPGGWIRPPEDCQYSAPAADWSSVGGRAILYYRPGRWYSVTEPKVCKEPPSCTDGATPAPRDR